MTRAVGPASMNKLSLFFCGFVIAFLFFITMVLLAFFDESQIAGFIVAAIIACYLLALLVAASYFLVVCWRRGRLAGLLGSVVAVLILAVLLHDVYLSGERGVAFWESFELSLIYFFFWFAGPVAAGLLARWKKRGSAIGWMFLSWMSFCLTLPLLLWVPDSYWKNDPNFPKSVAEKIVIYALIGILILALYVCLSIATRL